MFTGLSGAALAVHSELTLLFWILLTPVMVTTITMQFLKGKNEILDPGDILRRAVIAILLIFSIKFVFTSVADISDAITAKISQDNSVWEFLERLGPNYDNSTSDSWFDFKQSAIYVLSLFCYLVAYLGFFISEAIVAFMWAVLFALSPLMILCFISKATSNITVNLYKGLVTVATWRILYACLGALLMNVELSQYATGLDDWLLAAVVNLCIGISMLLVPLFTRSLIGDGLAGAGASLATGTTLAAAGLAKGLAMKAGKRTMEGAAFASKPLTNPVAGRARLAMQSLDKRFALKKRLQQGRQNWKDMNLPKEVVDQRKKAARAKAIARVRSRNRAQRNLEQIMRKAINDSPNKKTDRKPSKTKGTSHGKRKTSKSPKRV